MKRPTGREYSNEEKVFWMLQDNKEKVAKQASLLDSKESLDEIKETSNEEINKATAIKWGNRAMAYYHRILEEEGSLKDKFKWLASSEDFYRESLEHASGTEDTKFFADLHTEISKIRKEVYDTLDSTLSKISKQASTYTDQEMEQYYIEQHEMGDDPNGGGGHTVRDWNHSTTDYPKPEDLEKYKVRLDIMMNPSYRKHPFQDTPPYEVTWFFSQPSGSYNGDY